MKQNIQLFNSDFKDKISEIPDKSVKAIVTDPPYLYLKHKLDIPFDEDFLFSEAKRILKDDGFIVIFGRGTSFYRWCTKLADLGFIFKEEIIWDKSQTSSPLMAMSRVHETIAIFTKKSGKINKVKIPYLEMKKHNIDSIITDIKRLKSALNNTNSLNSILEFLETNKLDYTKAKSAKTKHLVSTSNPDSYNTIERSDSCFNSIVAGLTEKTIIRTDRKECETFSKYNITSDKRESGDRSVNCMQSIEFGLNEKTIIKELRDHYKSVHPTQKPVRLLERLLMLTTSENDLVVDPFFGSCSTALACKNTNRNFIGYEIDKEYFEVGKKRIDECISQDKFIEV